MGPLGTLFSPSWKNKQNFLVPRLKISGEKFLGLKNKNKLTLKKCLIFLEIELSSPKLKKLLYFFLNFFLIFKDGTCKLGNQKFLIFLQKSFPHISG